MPLLRFLIVERAVAPELEIWIVSLNLEPRAGGGEEGSVGPAVKVNLEAVVSDATGIGLDADVGKLADIDCGEAEWKSGCCAIGPAEVNDFGGLGADLEPVPEIEGVKGSDDGVGALWFRGHRGEGGKRVFGGV